MVMTASFVMKQGELTVGTEVDSRLLGAGVRWVQGITEPSETKTAVATECTGTWLRT
jgi:hypothetical protein